MEPTTTISALDVINLVQGISTTNLGYLGLCVTIILFAGGFFYLFNFNPIQKKIEKQENDLELLKKEIEAKIETAKNFFGVQISAQALEFEKNIKSHNDVLVNIKKEAFDKISQTEKQLNSYKDQYRHMLLDMLWQEHYMWDGNKIYHNSLSVLISYMEKAIDFKLTYLTDLCFDRVTKMLTNIKNEPEGEGVDEQDKNSLLGLFGKIQNFEKEKVEIKNLLTLAKSKIHE